MLCCSIVVVSRVVVCSSVRLLGRAFVHRVFMSCCVVFVLLLCCVCRVCLFDRACVCVVRVLFVRC